MMRWGRDSGTRLVGVDMARGVAILGMLWVHFAPDGTGLAAPDGRSAILFATLAGVSLGLLTGGAHPFTGTRRRAGYRTVAIRGLVLVALGRLLVLLGTPIAIILDYYGVAFLVMLIALFAPRWVLAIVAALAVSVGAALIQWAGPNPAGAFLSGDVLAWPSQWFLTGLYPVALFVGYVAAGLVAARSDLSKTSVQVALIVGGAVLAAVGYSVGGALGADAGPHANTTWEAIGSGGVALAVLGVLQLVSRFRVIRAVLSPVADIGAMPLTIYTGQVLVAAVFLATQPDSLKFDIGHWWLLAALAAGSLLFAVVWRRLVGRGPLEQLLALISRPPSAGPAGASVGPRQAAVAPASPDRESSLPIRTGRALAVGTGAALSAIALVVVASLLIVPARPDAATADVLTRLDVPTGEVTIVVNPGLVEQSGVSVGATGSGSLDRDGVVLPVVTGQVTVTETTLGGGILTDGSGISLTRGSAEVELTDLLLDLDVGAISGDVTVNGVSAAEDALLFEFTADSPPTEGGAGEVILSSATITMVPATGVLIDEGLASQGFSSADVFGTAAVALSGS